MPIIPLSEPGLQTHTWQWHLQNACRSRSELTEAVGLDSHDHQMPVESGNDENDFPIMAPWPYINRMVHGDPKDPLLLQVLSSEAEQLKIPGYVDQPLEEENYSLGDGLIQKYESRVLIMTTGACAIHCRYCFRRHFPYQDYQPTQKDWSSLIQRIEADDNVHEVILSGGDPLILSDSNLATIFKRINEIEHVDTIRIHTRLPVVVPQRITDTLCNTIRNSKKHIVVVIHSNHANELDEEVRLAMAFLSDAGATLLNQTVLLKGVNDSSDTIVTLSRKLFSIGVLPYYLHVLDPVSGAAHFDTGEAIARNIVTEATARLPGYLVPRLVREVPGTDSKQRLL